MHLLRSVRTYIFAALLMVIPASSFGGLAVSITVAPPALPVYAQPICPGDGYIWTPGYWAYGPDGYYWVRGAWVLAPQPGLLWTPGYWGFEGGVYGWHVGYWGPHVGFYGGVNYGFGYGGVGFEGGRWDHGHFFYNTAVSHVNVTVIHNVYRTNVVERPGSRMSFNGRGGIDARPTADQERFSHEQHFERTQAQVQREHVASTHRENFASENHGHPVAMHNNNVPRPGGNPHNNMQMEHAHNTNVPRPQNGGFHNAPPNNGHPHNEVPHNAQHNAPPNNGHPHNEAPHNAQHNAPPNNGHPHNEVPHNAQHNAPPQHNEPHNNGGGHGGGDHHDNKDHH